MGLLHEKARLLGRTYRGGYEGEGTGIDGGGYGGGAADGGGFAGSPVERSDLADLNAGGSASLTGGNLATGGTGFGFAPGPVTNAEAAGWVDSLSGNTPADAVIVTPAAPPPTLLQQITTFVSKVVDTVVPPVAAVLGIASGNPIAMATGLKSGLQQINAATSGSGSSAAPSVVDPGAAGASAAVAAFAGAPEGGMGTNREGAIFGAPVLGFDGGFLNIASTPTGAGSIAASLTPSAVPLSASLGAALRDPYAVPTPAPAAEPALAPALVLAGLASFLFMG